MTSAHPEALARVAARIREQLSHLERVVSALQEAMERWGSPQQDIVIVHWVGGLVHDFYTGVEKAFAEISPELNGRAPGGEAWHKDLLHTMPLDLPGFRPAVIARQLEERLLEHLRFRHLYRNLYSFHLRWDRVRALSEDALGLWPNLRESLERFARVLDELSRG